MDGGDDNAGSAVGEAFAEFTGTTGGANGVCLKVIVFEHSLVIEVLAVHDKDDLFDKPGFCQAACSFEAREGLTAAGSMPDVAAGFLGTEALGVIVGDFDTVDDSLVAAIW